MGYILKEYEKYRIMHEDALAQNSLYTFRGALLNEGWIDYMIEGGVVSPDGNTIFIYNRSPYYGQLLQFNKDTALFTLTVQNLVKAGYFKEMN